jgi:hypothetical protein
MTVETIIYILISGILALSLALFQYLYKSKKSKPNIYFAILRFITIFSVLLLLVNPKFEQRSVYVEKPNLVVAIDNSNSIVHLNQENNAQDFINKIKENNLINDKFNIDYYTFGNELNNTDSLSFTEKQTNINKALKQISQIYKETTSPILLITDGNQTYGNDYAFFPSVNKEPIYPIILGDTITHIDLKIQQLNTNKYAYLKNRFPVETIVIYSGNKGVSTQFEVTSGNKVVYSERVNFNDKEGNSKIIYFSLPANRTGVHSYQANIIPLDTEKNIINNTKNFAVEVIDQKTEVAIVSSFSHPDIGALKKSIESNEQRNVSLFKPSEFINKVDDFQLVILYQPNNYFKSVFEVLNTKNKNRFVITGTQTDWQFLNANNQSYSNSITNETEDFLAELNSNYHTFIIENLDFESFPPLKSSFGDVMFNVPIETLLYKKVGSISTENPLLGTFETNGRREAILLGENIWQWRAQSFLNTSSFDTFDSFIGKIVQYLASNNRKSRLNITHESFYNGNSNIIINAQYFNKNYEFDNRESLTISVKNELTEEVSVFPFILKNNAYQVDLSSLPASDYSFIVKTTSENISQSGSFKILEYSVEQQFLNANVTKLQQIATNSKGKSYFIANHGDLINELLNDIRYVSIQKSNKNTIPLIDWKYLLILIALSLAIEWFLRKYNGLI